MLGKRVYIQTDHKRLYHILPRTNKTYTCKPNLKDWNVQTHQELLMVQFFKEPDFFFENKHFIFCLLHSLLWNLHLLQRLQLGL
jgi:hypothetical protein